MASDLVPQNELDWMNTLHHAEREVAKAAEEYEAAHIKLQVAVHFLQRMHKEYAEAPHPEKVLGK